MIHLTPPSRPPSSPRSRVVSHRRRLVLSPSNLPSSPGSLPSSPPSPSSSSSEHQQAVARIVFIVARSSTVNTSSPPSTPELLGFIAVA
ncbi:hypothetical protein HN51_069112, partial [Arachis hypogaea]